MSQLGITSTDKLQPKAQMENESSDSITLSIASRAQTEVKGRTFCRNRKCKTRYIEAGAKACRKCAHDFKAYTVGENHWHPECFTCCKCDVNVGDGQCGVHTDPETYATSILCPKCYEKMKSPKWYQNKKILFMFAFVALGLVALAFGLGFGLSNHRSSTVVGLTCSQQCSPNSICEISPTTANCVCNEGYIGDGITCAQIA